MKNPILAIVLPILFCAACNDKEDPCARLVIPQPVSLFVILDQSTGLSLVGEDRLYKPDSIAVFNLFPPIRPSLNNDTVLELFYGGEGSFDQYFLTLSSTELDTIDVVRYAIERECFTEIQLRRFSYNSDSADFKNGIYCVFK